MNSHKQTQQNEQTQKMSHIYTSINAVTGGQPQTNITNSDTVFGSYAHTNVHARTNTVTHRVDEVI